MKAYLWRTERTVQPFLDSPGDVLICNESLRDRQQETLAAAGLEVIEVDDPTVIDDQDFLLIRDDLYFNDLALQRFLERSEEHAGSSACALEQGPFTEFTRRLQDLRSETDDGRGIQLLVYGMYRCRQSPATIRELHLLDPLPIEANQRPHPIEVGRFLPPHLEVSFTPATSDALLLHLSHWVNVWQINLLVLVAKLFRTFMPNRRTLLLRAISALSLNRHKIASRLVVKGRGCDVHPSATVQASILGDGVVIGPHSMVHGCILGSGVRVSEQTIVAASVFGQGALIGPRGCARVCVVYPDSVVGVMQGSIVGRSVFIAQPARFLDLKLQGTIKVRHGDRRADSGLNFLGACIGHGCVIGADCWFGPGVDIPNGTFVVSPPGDVITSISPDVEAGRPATVKDGTLMPVSMRSWARRPRSD